MLNKLCYYGVRGIPLQLFNSYLTNRYQQVVFNSVTSTRERVRAGVPQGSILGAILFIIYVNDLPENISSRTILYADDTSIITKGNSEEDVAGSVEDAVEEANNWFTQNNLKLNTNKTTQLKIRTHNTGEERTHVNFLGVRINNVLTWKEHIDQLLSKLSTVIYMIRQLYPVCDYEVLRAAYFANFHSVATYGIIIWGATLEMSRVFQKQKQALRATYGIWDQTYSCKELFKSSKILTIPCTYIFACVKYLLENSSQYVDHQHHPHDTRGRSKLLLPFHRICKSETSTNSHCVKIFNKIPRGISTQSTAVVLGWLKTVLLQYAFYSTQEFMSFNFSNDV